VLGMPALPSQATANNRFVGTVDVTYHAWARFCSRYLSQCKAKMRRAVRAGPNFVLRELQNCFGRAEPVTITDPARVRRLIRNEFQAVSYLYDSGTNLRFVVREGQPPTLLTIEKALYK